MTRTPLSSLRRSSVFIGRSLAPLALCSFALVACGGEMQPADVVTDRGVVSDSSTVMDSGVVEQDVGTTPTDTGVSPPDVQSQPDAPAPMDVSVSNSCCRAFSMANQARCDGLDPNGPALCNAADDGTTCAWSLEPRCNDSGVPIDAGPPPNCCLAINAANAAFCTTLSSFGVDRCNRADGGGVCVWSGAMVCNPAPPMDSGVRTDASTDVSRIDVTLRDTGVIVDTGVVVDSGVPSCCLARTGSNGATCRTYTTMAQCSTATAMIRTCVWSPTPLCTSSLGLAGACCIPTRSALNNAICGGLNTAASCGGNAACQWRCP